MSHTISFEKSRPIDVICMGRVAVDLYSEQVGCSLEETETFRKYLGGCAGNIAVGTSRLGLNSAMFSCVGKDAMGQFLKTTLIKENVNVSLLKETTEHLTGLVLLGINPPNNFPLIFYRNNCADMQLKKEDVSKEFFATAKALLITGTGFSTSSMRETSHYAIDVAKSVNTSILFDLDFRPVLWGLTASGDGESRYKASQSVSQHYHDVLPKCDLIVGTEEEILIAGGADKLENAISSIRDKTAAPIVLKRGEKGCVIFLVSNHNPITAQAFPVKILNVLGAGDGFMSGFLRGLLRGESWEICATYGNACGAILVTRHGCAPAMPTFNEMQELMNETVSGA